MLGRWRQLAQFTAAGVVGLVVDVGGLYVALQLGLGYYLGRGVSFLFAVWVTWHINRRITFRAGHRRATWREWWQYLCAMFPGGSVNYLCYALLVALLPEHAYLPAFAVAVSAVVGMGVNFAMAKWWVYKGRPKDSPQ
jgi:putative flippase GtrA